MKTNTFFAAVITFSLVIFLSLSGISNPTVKYTGDIKKNESTTASTTKKATPSTVNYIETISDFSYLRFDVNEYVAESTIEELPVNTFDYLRFDVNNFDNENETEEMELPAANEFDYLRFNVNNFIDTNSAEINELPANDFDYLRFDVNKFANTTEGVIYELPIKE